MIPAPEMELTWAEPVWRENQELWVDRTLYLRYRLVSRQTGHIDHHQQQTSPEKTLRLGVCGGVRVTGLEINEMEPAFSKHMAQVSQMGKIGKGVMNHSKKSRKAASQHEQWPLVQPWVLGQARAVFALCQVRTSSSHGPALRRGVGSSRGEPSVAWLHGLILRSYLWMSWSCS